MFVFRVEEEEAAVVADLEAVQSQLTLEMKTGIKTTSPGSEQGVTCKPRSSLVWPSLCTSLLSYKSISRNAKNCLLFTECDGGQIKIKKKTRTVCYSEICILDHLIME